MPSWARHTDTSTPVNGAETKESRKTGMFVEMVAGDLMMQGLPFTSSQCRATLAATGHVTTVSGALPCKRSAEADWNHCMSCSLLATSQEG